MTDQHFPLIDYQAGKTPLEWGQMHGEMYRDGIKELIQIRKELMLQKNPSIKEHLDLLAKAQWGQTKIYAPDLISELEGIYLGSKTSLTDITILNNYTDFRDLSLPDEGCSTIHVQNNEHVYSGQTWDMHGSAKDYVCLIKTPATEKSLSSINFSLIGCVGMMGINSKGCLVGVNNINTQNARAGLIWPALVRKLLKNDNLSQIKSDLKKAPVTSGHNYLVSSFEGGAHLEITPTEKEEVLTCQKNDSKTIFHTNHCLGKKVKKLEDPAATNSTTHIRFELLQKKTENLNSLQDLIALLNDHENYPKSICSHFESGAQDPSYTCGGGASDLSKESDKLSIFWRGCKVHDKNYKEMSFKLTSVEHGQEFQLI